MGHLSLPRHLIHWLIALLTVSALVGCATGPEIVDHQFTFDMRDDNQEDVEVLDFRYGSSRLPGAQNPDWLRAEGKSLQATGVHGPMRRGDELYVKWRIKSTGQVYEDTADLRHRLPADITDCDLTFLIRGPQLYVYLATPKRHDKNEPPNGPKKFHYQKTLTIYPDQSYRQPQ